MENKNNITIKGIEEGLLFIFDTNNTTYNELCNELENKLQASGDFFYNADYIIDDPSLFDNNELTNIEQILEKHSLHKGQLANRKTETEESSEVVYHPNGGDSVLITQSIRSGQKIHVYGNAIVMGDINAGGEIIATGNIVVMGSCRGLLHAGAEGNKNCFIIVYHMALQQLRIADSVATIPPGMDSEPLKLACIHSDEIIITDYSPNQFRTLHLDN